MAALCERRLTPDEAATLMQALAAQQRIVAASLPDSNMPQTAQDAPVVAQAMAEVPQGQQVKAVQAGDLSRGEAMLVEQAATLDAIFHRLAR